MPAESVVSLGSIGGVTVGLGVLLIGVASHGGELLQTVGGAVVVLSVGALAMSLSRLDSSTEPIEKG
ncbi:hypothetical protein [Halocatena pleomorpha]|uniref:Uncharacterized protein n=1 Tax=Halocatena pleomorpha TaxID=1785090 RepID=A0A3P3RHL9_9EURY|nr:hypothetical protein [Halocatena pleomorpha]RRJ32845.1 hypothetical protein EIK79_04105 [Halocatena pleomorpha]